MASRLNPEAAPFAFTSAPREPNQHGPIDGNGPPPPSSSNARQDSLAQIPGSSSSATKAPNNLSLNDAPRPLGASIIEAIDPTTYHHPGTHLHVYFRGEHMSTIDMALGARFSDTIRSSLQSPDPSATDPDGCPKLDLDFPNAHRDPSSTGAWKGLSRCLIWMYKNASLFHPILPLNWPVAYGNPPSTSDVIDLYAAALALKLEPHPDHLEDILLGRVKALGFAEDMIEIAVAFPDNDVLVGEAFDAYAERAWDWGSDVMTAQRLVTVLRGEARVRKEFRRMFAKRVVGL